MRATLCRQSSSRIVINDDDDVDPAQRVIRKTYRIAKRSIAELVRGYFAHNASARTACEHLMRVSGETMENLTDAEYVARETPLDHLAFRSLGTKDMGIEGVCERFEACGYVLYEESEDGPAATYRFQEKRVRARWMRPPETPIGEIALPRIFVSELVLEECDADLRSLVEGVLARVSDGKVFQSGEYADGRIARWQLPAASTYAKLQKLSEYASWTLLHGYAVNHIAVSLFQLRKKYPKTPIRALEDVDKAFAANAALARKPWNDRGGRIKRSPSGLLLQSSFMSEPHRFNLYKQTQPIRNRYGRDDEEEIFKEYKLPGSYIEFVQSMPRHEHADKAFEELNEQDLRDGFESSNADQIFESTSVVLASAQRNQTPPISGTAAPSEPPAGPRSGAPQAVAPRTHAKTERVDKCAGKGKTGQRGRHRFDVAYLESN